MYAAHDPSILGITIISLAIGPGMLVVGASAA
jgi:hypothetical protein